MEPSTWPCEYVANDREIFDKYLLEVVALYDTTASTSASEDLSFSKVFCCSLVNFLITFK